MSKPAKTPAPTNGELLRRGLALGLVGVAGVAIVSGLRAEPVSKAAAFFRRFSAPVAVTALADERPAPGHLHAQPLSDELKKKGYHE